MIQVQTLEELFRIDPERLRELDIVEVSDLPDTPATLPWSEKRHWTKRVVFTRKPISLDADGDVVFAHPGGGNWIRMRDIA